MIKEEKANDNDSFEKRLNQLIRDFVHMFKEKEHEVKQLRNLVNFETEVTD